MKWVKFYDNEQIDLDDMSSTQALLISNLRDILSKLMYPNDSTFSGFTTQATAPESANVEITEGILLQSGSILEIPTGTKETVNILATDSNNWGDGQAADATNPRYSIVCVKYGTKDVEPVLKTFFDPINNAEYTQTINTRTIGYYDITVVHGTAAASPAVPATPSGYIKAAEIYVPAGATTITAANVTNTLPTTIRSVGDIDQALSAHVSNPTGAHAASAISIADAGGYFTSVNAETALQEEAAARSAHAAAAAPHSGHALTTRQIIAGSGLTGGGDLTADRTLSIANSAITDTLIGTRTIDQAIATAAGNTGTPTQLWSWQAKQIKAITGKANWYDAPRIPLEYAADLRGDTFTGDVTFNTQIKSGIANFHLVPTSGGAVGITDYAQSRWNFYVTDGGTVSTVNNTLDDGSGGSSFANTLKITHSDNNLHLDTPAVSQYALTYLKDAGATKWFYGKDVNNDFFIWNNAGSGSVPLRISTNNVITTPNNTLDDGSGSTILAGGLTINNNAGINITGANPYLTIGGNSGAGTGWGKIESPEHLYINYDHPTTPVEFGNSGNSLTMRVWGSLYSKNNTLDDGSGNASIKGLTINHATVPQILFQEGDNTNYWYLLQDAGTISFRVNGYGTNAFHINPDASVYTLYNTLDDGSGLSNFIGQMKLQGNNLPLTLHRTSDANGLWMNFTNAAGAEIAWMGYGTGGSNDFSITNSLGNLKLNPNGGVVSTHNNTLDDGSGNAVFSKDIKSYSTSVNPTLTLDYDGAAGVGSKGRLSVFNETGGGYTGGISIDGWHYNGTIYELMVGVLKASGSGKVTTLHNTLDDGSGNVTINGQSVFKHDDYNITIDTNTAGTYGIIYFKDAGATKWWVGKTPSNGFGIYNSPQGAYSFAIGPDNAITTKNNTLDDGSGIATLTQLNLPSKSGASILFTAGGAYLDEWSNINLPSTFGTWNVFNIDSGSVSHTALAVDGYGSANPNRVRTLNNTLDDGTGKMTLYGQLMMAGVSGQASAYVYGNGNGVSSGFGTDMSGSSYELSYFASTDDAYSHGRHSWGFRRESDGAYIPRMTLSSNGLLTTRYNWLEDGSGRLGISTQPAITLALGDSDTGFHYETDGVFHAYANNVNIMNFHPDHVDLNVQSNIYAQMNMFEVSSAANSQSQAINWRYVDGSGVVQAKTMYTATDGNLVFGGSNVWNTGNFDPNSKMNTSGGTFTGDIIIQSTYPTFSLDNTGFTYHPRFISDQNSLWIEGRKADGTVDHRIRWDMSGSHLYVDTDEVWHAGNFNPNTKANLSGDTFTGNVNMASAVIGSAITAITPTQLQIAKNNAAVGSGSYGSGHIQLATNDGSNPILGFHRAGYFGRAIYLHANGDFHTIDSNGGDYRIWDSGNLGVSTAANANTVAERDGNGYIFATVFNDTIGVDDGSAVGSIMFKNGSDSFFRHMSVSRAQSILGVGGGAFLELFDAGGVTVYNTSVNTYKNNLAVQDDSNSVYTNVDTKRSMTYIQPGFVANKQTYFAATIWAASGTTYAGLYDSGGTLIAEVSTSSTTPVVVTSGAINVSGKSLYVAIKNSTTTSYLGKAGLVIM